MPTHFCSFPPTPLNAVQNKPTQLCAQITSKVCEHSENDSREPGHDDKQSTFYSSGSACLCTTKDAATRSSKPPATSHKEVRLSYCQCPDVPERAVPVPFWIWENTIFTWLGLSYDWIFTDHICLLLFTGSFHFLHGLRPEPGHSIWRQTVLNWREVQFSFPPPCNPKLKRKKKISYYLNLRFPPWTGSLPALQDSSWGDPQRYVM